MAAKRSIEPSHFKNRRWTRSGVVSERRCHGLPAHFHEEECRYGVEKNDHKNRRNHGGGRMHTRGLSAAAHDEPLQATNSCDQKGKNGRFRHAHKEMFERNIPLYNCYELSW